MWQTMCTVGTFKADVAYKIILKNLTNIKNATSPKKILNQKNTKKKKKKKTKLIRLKIFITSQKKFVNTIL